VYREKISANNAKPGESTSAEIVSIKLNENEGGAMLSKATWQLGRPSLARVRTNCG
jgi:hypothetical protein